MPALKICKFFLVLVCTILISFSFTTHAYAALRLNQLIVRLNDTTPGSKISGLVCAQPSHEDAEGKVSITFPSSFHISLNKSDWSASVDDLPDDVTPWTGISTQPTAISGNTVTFSSDDIAASDLSCFFISSTSSTVDGSTGSASGTVSTYTLFNYPLESKDFGVMVAPDGVTVSATVQANSKDYAANLFLLNGISPYPENSTLEFELRYTSDLPYDPGPFTVQAEWSPGVIENTDTTIDPLEYVVDSATPAYGNTLPVVDTVKHTITWRISTLPSGHVYSVKFSLRVKNIYTGPSKVQLRVASRAILAGVATPDSNVYTEFQYSKYNPNTPKPFPAPQFKSIDIASVTNTTATIRVDTSKNTKSMTIKYGKKPSKLDKSLTTTFLSNHQELELQELETGTPYYFRIYMTDEDNLSAVSDLFYFKTSSLSVAPKIDPSTFLISSNNSLLLVPSDITHSTVLPIAVIPVDTPYQLRFAMVGGSLISDIQLITRNDHVLGASTNEPDISSDQVDMAELTKNIFIGQLLSKNEPGTYTQIARIQDYYGSIVETPVAKVRTVKPLTVFDSQHHPVEKARIHLFLYNPTTRTYENIANTLLVANPLYTTSDGTVPIVLPKGQYKVEVSAIGYSSAESEFSVGLQPDDGYPQITLTKQPFNLINYAEYYYQDLSDAAASLHQYMENIQQSHHSFNLLILLVLLLTVFSAYLSFHVRTRRPLIHYLRDLPLPRLKNYNKVLLSGRILNQNGKPIVKAQVYLKGEATEHIITTTHSDINGHFSFMVLPDENYRYMIVKNGFEPAHAAAEPGERLKIVLYQTHPLAQTIKGDLLFIIEKLGGGIFEILILLSLVFELIFSFSFGLTAVTPFLILTLLNILLWYRFQRNREIQDP